MGLKELGFIVFISMGTYFLRFLPLRLSLKNRRISGDGNNLTTELIEVSGTSIIAALLVSSITLPEYVEALVYVLNLFLSSAAVILTCFIWKNPGLSVISGMLSFGLISYFFF